MATIVSKSAKPYDMHRTRLRCHLWWTLIAAAMGIVLGVAIWINPEERLRELTHGAFGLAIGAAIFQASVASIHWKKSDKRNGVWSRRRSVSMHVKRADWHRVRFLSPTLLLLVAFATIAMLLTRGNHDPALVIGGIIFAIWIGHGYLWAKHHHLAADFGKVVGGAE